MFYFYHRNDKTQEPIRKVFITKSRLSAAKYFAEIKQMKLKEFLGIFGVSK
jgi:hypothetical protein